MALSSARSYSSLSYSPDRYPLRRHDVRLSQFEASSDVSCSDLRLNYSLEIWFISACEEKARGVIGSTKPSDA